ncbi:MAG: adenylate/guanylate cyclase domain-containing protein [Planctomycetota bacterium]|jgi:class 3 adenylate cyclase/tetratricopeptide (TPR) repeat protein
MECPKCQFENPKDSIFCGECGYSLELKVICPNCGSRLPKGFKFCNKCGHDLEKLKETPTIDKTKAESQLREIEADEVQKSPETIETERKHVTVLFSDLSGYTTMSEKLDPEEVKEITSRIFDEISKVINKYEGFVEKFVGDAVMALFGVPKAHEDDPIRAIRAAREIHEVVEAVSPEVENKIGQPISMHTGINTGLVVTGEVDMERGTHGVAGDTINIASRLSSLAKAGEILVDPDTYRQAEGHFTFESLKPIMVKGKADSVQVHKVLSQKEKPITLHRLSGLRADIIGRKVELTELREAVEKLREGKGRIFSICGDAGTGKSRLIEEFKATLDLKEIQWLEGHAYSYAQNIPYFLLIDLLNRVFQIEEGDPPERIRERIESGIKDLVGKKEHVVPYVGSLYALSYPEVDDVSPEYWKTRMQDAILAILSALAQKAPTIFCLEDLHWADPSFVELLRNALLQIRQPAIVLCVYRPTFSLFTSHQLATIAKIYHEIRLQDLSLSGAQEMLESLLKTEAIPSDLGRFVQDKAEGNPFYLEELVNSLIETETLIRDNGSWRITRPISESDISSTIHGVIFARLDRLENETKRILQEASVIGRAFLYEILKRITELKQEIDQCLIGLERVGLIRTKSLQPDLEYIFKHALTQEVAYNGLLKTERKEIHEQIAIVIEQLFNERLPEFYETLAFHFSRGKSIIKALHYLIKSGEKSLRRYSLSESHEYFKEAFDILSAKSDMTKDDERLLIDLLIEWAFVFYYRGTHSELLDLLKTHENLAESLGDKEKLGIFDAWLGMTLHLKGIYRDSYKYLDKSLKLGEEIQNNKVIGYSCAWLSRTCADLGLLDDAVVFGQRAQKISGLLKSDKDLYRFAMVAMGYAHFFRGESKKASNIGEILLDCGQRESDNRMMTMGHIILGFGGLVAGDLPSAIECFQKSIQVSVDPLVSNVAKTLIGYGYLANEELQKAESILEEVMSFSENVGFEFIKRGAQALHGIVLLTEGNLSKGIKILKDISQIFLVNGNKYRYATFMYFQGKAYSQMVQVQGPRNLSFLIRNIGFLFKNIPFASRKAEDHFNKAIQVAEEIGAKGILGKAYLDLGLLHNAKERKAMAMECISNAIQLFKQCEAEVYLKQAKEALASLG